MFHMMCILDFTERKGLVGTGVCQTLSTMQKPSKAGKRNDQMKIMKDTLERITVTQKDNLCALLVGFSVTKLINKNYNSITKTNSFLKLFL